MARVLRTDVHVQKDGKPEVLKAGSTLPKWATKLVTNEKAFIEVQTAAAEEQHEETGPYAALDLEGLKAALKERELPVSGNKDELIARLTEDDAEKAKSSDNGAGE